MWREVVFGVITEAIQVGSFWPLLLFFPEVIFNFRIKREALL